MIEIMVPQLMWDTISKNCEHEAFFLPLGCKHSVRACVCCMHLVVWVLSFVIQSSLQRLCNHVHTTKTIPLESLIDFTGMGGCHSKCHYSKCFWGDSLPFSAYHFSNYSLLSLSLSRICLFVSLFPFSIYVFLSLSRCSPISLWVHKCVEFSIILSWSRCTMFQKLWLSCLDSMKWCQCANGPVPPNTYFDSSAVYQLPAQPFHDTLHCVSHRVTPEYDKRVTDADH